MHTRTAVALLAGSVNCANLQEQPVSLARPFARGPPLRRVEPGSADAQHPTHQVYSELAPVLRDAGVLHSDWFAKYAAAFFKKSRSWVTRSSSRRSLWSSAASPVITP